MYLNGCKVLIGGKNECYCALVEVSRKFREVIYVSVVRPLQ